MTGKGSDELRNTSHIIFRTIARGCLVVRFQGIRDLSDEKSRRMAAQNPLLQADVGHYKAELAASRRCLRTVVAQ